MHTKLQERFEGLFGGLLTIERTVWGNTRVKFTGNPAHVEGPREFVIAAQFTFEQALRFAQRMAGYSNAQNTFNELKARFDY